MDQGDYVCRLLDAYRDPGFAGAVRPRMVLAAQPSAALLDDENA
jgi:hypothetical protein